MQVQVLRPNKTTAVASFHSASKNRILLDFGRLQTLYEFDRRGRGKSPLRGWRIVEEDLERIRDEKSSR